MGFMVSWNLGSVAEKPRPPSGLGGFRPLVHRPLSPFPGLQMGSIVCRAALEHLEGSLSPVMHMRWGCSEGLEEGGEPGLDRGLNRGPSAWWTALEPGTRGRAGLFSGSEGDGQCPDPTFKCRSD